jgi:hypothetical protein
MSRTVEGQALRKKPMLVVDLGQNVAAYGPLPRRYNLNLQTMVRGIYLKRYQSFVAWGPSLPNPLERLVGAAGLEPATR